MITNNDLLNVLYLIESHLETIKGCLITLTIIGIFHTTTKLKLFFNKEEKNKSDDIFNKPL